MPAVNPADDLQAKWYNTLTAAIGVSPNQFQLLQPPAPLGDTSKDLWSYFNDLPPETLVRDLEDSGGDQFYSNYSAVVNQLIPQSGNALARDLGDHYSAWMAFRAKNPGDIVPVFRQWALDNAPGLVAKGTSDLLAQLHDPIVQAQEAVVDQSKFADGTPDFSKTMDDLQNALQGAAGTTFSFDSATASSDITNTWSSGSTGIFFFDSSASSQSTLVAKMTSARYTVNGSFKSILTLQADPGSWYSSSTLGAAFSTQDNTLWNHGTPSWNTTFGPNGNMLNFAASIVVVDGVDITITSEASYSSDDQTHIRTVSSGGFWPFYSTSHTSTFDAETTFDSNGLMTVHVTNPAGNPLVLGVNVVPARQYILGQAVTSRRRAA
ncbi:MAG: hypothetical protein M3P06_01435 [Acidobacteriota bacterium]|nr:hypothetical protein [Acidobacteriota bacterium]